MEKKKKVIRYGLDDAGMLGVNIVSFVDYPAIEDDFIALQRHGNAQIKLSAVNEEKRMVYGAAMIPEKEILRIDAETGEEFFVVFPAEVIEAVVRKFMRTNSHHNVNLMHEYAVDGVTFVECWLKHSDADKSIALGLTPQPNGTWYLGAHVENEAVWEEVKNGELRGFSIEGFFRDMSSQFAIDADLQRLIDDIECAMREKGRGAIAMKEKSKQSNHNKHGQDNKAGTH
jgi:hypothetical protein